jgi:arylsulfatase A
MKINYLLLICISFFCFPCFAQKSPISNVKKSNIVVIFLDDSGFSDFKPFNSEDVSTPNVEKLAKEGVKYTRFYVPQSICSASRASLLTGCYPQRTKVYGATLPNERGLETTFPTIAEIFKSAGYKTALFGKWHIGDQPDTRPNARGFDESCGIMYSADMWKFNTAKGDKWSKIPFKFYENGKVSIEEIEPNDQKLFTKWYTEHAVNFIHKNKNQPFMLYLPYNMPHVPVFCSKEFEGKSGKGIYVDVIMELDFSIGKILKALKDNGLDNNTIVVFSSDNGPWSSFGNHAGKTPFREAKATSFDGGIHSACIIKYPKKLRPAVSDKTFCSIDILPTLCYLTGVPLPKTEIDGKNVWPLISGEKSSINPQPYYVISNFDKLECILSSDGKWKLHLPHDYRTVKEYGKDGVQGTYDNKKLELSLFDLEHDPYETKNVIKENKKIADKLLEFATIEQKKF